MVILRDEKRIARLRRLSQYMSLIGLVALVIGLIMAFTAVPNYFFYQLLALLVGWLFSQVGVYLGHRYVRSPRPDEVLDEAVRKVARNGRLYHYLLPAPHVLLLPQGIILFVAKFQGGKITAEGERWKQTGVGLRKFFGQEALGNPSKEAEVMVGALANYLRKHAPEVEDVPIAPIIVFTSKTVAELNVKNANLPAMHASKLKGFLRQQYRKEPSVAFSRAEYEAVRAAFDRRAAHLLAESPPLAVQTADESPD
jgi:hypothetical protein